MRTHTFTFNPNDNGGQHVTLVTAWVDGDEEPSQRIELRAYGRTASLDLPYDLTPTRLRKLADELEGMDCKYVTGLVRNAVEKYPEQAQAYREGDKRTLGIFVGEVMKQSRGVVDPVDVDRIAREILVAE